MAMALPSTAGEPTGLLTAREIAAFKRDGYFIRRGILSAELCAAARDRLWALNEFRSDSPTRLRKLRELRRLLEARSCSWASRRCFSSG